MSGPGPLLERVRRRLAKEGWSTDPPSVTEALRAEGLVLPEATIVGLVHQLRTEVTGLGALESLARRPGVTDVLVNAPDEVWVDDGSGLSLTDVAFADEAAVRRLAQRLAGAVGRRLDDSTPYVDARLPSGIRLHAVLPPVSPRGTTVSLRIPQHRVFSLTDLAGTGMISQGGVEIVNAVIERREAFLITGGTGTGKTTLLNSMLSAVDSAERIVTVEDSAELQPDHQHVVRLESRPANSEGAGAVTIRDLVRQALRMRPDRLVIGEVRGAEVVDLLSALNTGHEGGCATLHANSPSDVPARLESLALPAGLSREGLHAQLSAGLQSVLHVERDRSGRRRLASIAVMDRAPSGLVEVVPAVVFDAGRMVDGPARARLPG
jgi:pilus assembly protein CpaF